MYASCSTLVVVVSSTPPVTSTVPSASSVQVWPQRGILSGAAGVAVPFPPNETSVALASLCAGVPALPADREHGPIRQRNGAEIRARADIGPGLSARPVEQLGRRI